jgi:hypothetical protein
MSVNKIQAFFRGYNVRSYFKLVKDAYTIDNLKQRVHTYCEYTKFINTLNTSFPKNHKKIRSCNLPEDISENIAKFAIFKKYKRLPSWNCGGDLEMYGKKLEVKGFTSSGPNSFGPGSAFHRLYFVDAIDIHSNFFKVYEIALVSTSDKFLNVKINKKETFGEICLKNQRGKLRGSFYTVFKPQLEDYCKLIFAGKLEDLE